MSSLTTTIIGFCLFGISELLPFLPVNSNGILDTFIKGFQNSFGNINNDISIANQLLNGTNSKEIANITNSVGTNTELKTCVNNILNNQAIIPHVNTLCTTPEIQTLMYSLKSDNILMNNVKNLVLNHTQSTININS